MRLPSVSQRRAVGGPASGAARPGVCAVRARPPVARTQPPRRCVVARAREVLLIAEDISMSHDSENKLFESLTFSVVEGDKLAVVGRNGSGKSTLLKLIAGQYDADSGFLSRHKGANVAYLAQEPVMPEGATVMQAVLQSDSMVAKAVQTYQKAMREADGVNTKELELAIEKMNTYNAWEIDAEAKRVLEAVGIPEAMFNQPVEKLSGGQQKRVALASALLGKPDLLILDEPTNHMDVEMIDWMEKELKSPELAVVLVTHDRYFMENVCDRMLEVDGGKSYMHSFGGIGSYELFKQAREHRRAAQAAAAADARTLFRKEAEWVVRQPQGRQAKQQARVKAFVELTARTKDMPKEDLRVDLQAGGMARQGNKVVKMEDVAYEAVPGRRIISDFTYTLNPGERLGIVGRNGAGKSTLLDLMAGVSKPTAGKIEFGETTVIGYFTQYPPPVSGDLRLINYIREIADTRAAAAAGLETGDTPEVVLEKVGFPRAKQYQYVSSLSGGERRRLHLASVLIERPNVLILDEPTNDLDLQTVEVLEEVCRSFKGVLLVVSHDRAFMDAVVDNLLVLKGDGIVRKFGGIYSEYLDMMRAEKEEEEALRQMELEEAKQKAEAEATKASGAASESSSKNGDGKSSANASSSTSSGGKRAASAPAAVQRAISYYERQEYEKLTKDIEKLSATRDKLDTKVMDLASSGSDLGELERLSMELAKIAEELDDKEMRWMELAELAGDL